jgi:prepilin-type N-terminal cleavage/methylation domain-containing protein
MRVGPTRAGYSLIELLVVIAIIAVLIGLSMGIFAIYGDSQRRMDKLNWQTQRQMGNYVERRVPMRAYFIGNSYTSTNDLPGMIGALAAAAGNKPSLQTDGHLAGGANLSQHWDDPSVHERIRTGNWDFVILQDQSQTPVYWPAQTDGDVKRFAAEIRNAGAIPLLFQTWTRTGVTPPVLESDLWETYSRAAAAHNCEISPAGRAWTLVQTAKPGIPLQQSDGSHPTPIGTYLTACVFYGAIFDRSPEGLPGQLVVNGQTAVSLPDADARTLQSYAWQAVQTARKTLAPEWQKISTR